MAYVDGYVLPVPKKNIGKYRKMAQIAEKVWRDHGALDYKECALEDQKTPCGVTFPKQMKLKKGETVVFAYILFKSRKHRDQVNAKVMKDPRIGNSMDPKDMPFDWKRMVYAGFDVIVGD